MKGVILTGGQVEDSIAQLFGDIATGLVPVQGRPILFYIINNFLNANINEIYIAVGHEATTVKRVIDTYFIEKADIHYVDVSPDKGPGDSLLTVLKTIGSGKVVVVLADTYMVLTPEAVALDNVVFASSDFEDSRKWCTVEANEQGHLTVMHQMASIDHTVYALVGVYILSDIRLFADFVSCQACLEISDLLYFYQQQYIISVVMTPDWLDFGHLEKYQISKKRLLEARYFNRLEFDDLLGTITKRSDQVEKFRHEVLWQLQLPTNLQILFPRILNYDLSIPNPWATMEYFGYQTVAEIWLYANFRPNILKRIIHKLFQILLLFRQEVRPVSLECYQEMYIHKTESRLALLCQENLFFKTLLSAKEVMVNGKMVRNWMEIKEPIFAKVASLYRPADNCLIHGDYCFSNILFDINHGIVRLLDPRGKWGVNAFGDFKYDLAKLRHSIHGDYDFIVNDLFYVDFNDAYSPEINYRIINAPYHDEISDYFDELISSEFDLEEIQWIEGMLFLSMIPLHSNSLKRQIVMFAKALEILNNFV